MRIVILAIGSRGDVQPYVALGLGLQDAGHDVRIITHDAYEAFVASYGLETVALPGDPGAILAGEAGQDWLDSGQNALLLGRRVMRVVEPFVREYIARCWSACAGAEGIIVSWLGYYVGSHIAEKMNVPLVRAYLQPITPTRAFPSSLVPTPLNLNRRLNRLTHVLFWHASWHIFRPALNAARREVLDLPALPHVRVFSDMYGSRYPVLYGYSPAVLPKPRDWPDWISVTGYWFLARSPEWQPDATLVDFLAAGPPPVYVGFGSMKERNQEEIVALLARALARAGQRGILLAGREGVKGDLGDDLLQIEGAPHDWLFPRMAAVVHHGGAGTLAAGLRAGIPSICVPYFADQPFWGRLVHKLEVGTQPIPRKQLSVERLADAISRAVSDTGMRERAAILGRRISAENGVARAIEALDRHLIRAAPERGDRPDRRRGAH